MHHKALQLTDAAEGPALGSSLSEKIMKAVRIICLFLFVVSQANAQARRLNEFHIGCGGWKTLAFAGQKSVVKDLEPRGMDGVEIHVKSHQLAAEQIVYIESCDAKIKEEPIREDKNYGRRASVVRGFVSYAINKKIFAYRFTWFLVMTKNGYVTDRSGASGDVYYIDEDGDGTFEKYLGAMPLRFLPDWVKNESTGQSPVPLMPSVMRPEMLREE